MPDSGLVPFTVRIVSAYVGHNPVAMHNLPTVISTVQQALGHLGRPLAPALQPERPKPAVAIKRSVTEDAISCLECGKRQRMLKRHLRTEHDLTPDEYRARWGLTGEYPMTAPNYAAQRSAFAKKIGLGRKQGPNKAVTRTRRR